jgi:hypothetical protein
MRRRDKAAFEDLAEQLKVGAGVVYSTNRAPIRSGL